MVDGGAVEGRKDGADMALAPSARKSRAIRIVFDQEFSQQNCISNRFWPNNRSYRKQTIKPRLTGSRFAFREFSFFTHSAARPSHFYKWSRPLLIDSDTPIEFTATRRKQKTGKFLTGARTHISNFTFSQNSATQIAPKFATLRSHRKLTLLREGEFDRKPVRRDRSCPIERIAPDARGCARWNRVGSIRTAHRSLGHADQ
jgi:hypothetical protein